MPRLQAIETLYRGYRMRSRLEARWAIFFDVLGVKYEYEPEGFKLGNLGWYLPDFWLETVQMWAEVKRGAFTDMERRKVIALVEVTDFPCLMLDGTPADQAYYGYEPGEWFDSARTEREGAFLTDYVLVEGHHYPANEGRFYTCTGNLPGDRRIADIIGPHSLPTEPVAAARKARFEHGEAA